MIKINIMINGVELKYQGDYDTVHNLDWNEIMRNQINNELPTSR